MKAQILNLKFWFTVNQKHIYNTIKVLSIATWIFIFLYFITNIF